ncbi:MAG: 30S ribosomal protein S6 [Elusimicrobia bacterium]|nr:30S ribosomal protein S6 [Elusimicrobiota bacterium]
MNQRQYETVFIVKPELSDAQAAEFLSKTKNLIANEGGRCLNEEVWGRRKLAYPIQREREGVYIQIRFESPPPVISKLEYHYRTSEPVLRFLTVLEQRADRKKEKKEKREKKELKP